MTGYVRTGSVPSIAAGVTVGALVWLLDTALTSSTSLVKAPELTQVFTIQYGLGGYRIQNNQPYGVEMALLASLVLAGSSIPRAIKTQKPLPIGLSLVAAFGLYRFGSVWSAQAR